MLSDLDYTELNGTVIDELENISIQDNIPEFA
jgi:hypothetical protein